MIARDGGREDGLLRRADSTRLTQEKAAAELPHSAKIRRRIRSGRRAGSAGR